LFWFYLAKITFEGRMHPWLLTYASDIT